MNRLIMRRSSDVGLGIRRPVRPEEHRESKRRATVGDHDRWLSELRAGSSTIYGHDGFEENEYVGIPFRRISSQNAT